MTAARVVEAVDVFKDGHLRLSSCLPCIAPDQFRFDGFEECLDGCVIITISFATHGHFEAVLPQDFLTAMRTILRPAISVMDAAFRRRSKRDSHVQRPDHKIAFHPVAHRPTDNAPGVQIEDHGKIQPAFARPYVADIACPFLIRLFCREVPIQQVWRNVELMIAVTLSADCFEIACRAMVVALCLRVLTTDMPF